MKATPHRLTPTRRRLRLVRQARPLYLVPTGLPVIRQSRLRWYRALAELIVGLLAVLAAAVVVSAETTHTARELLTESRSFISNPDRWCQVNLAVDSFGHPLWGSAVLEAEKCCGLGALHLSAKRSEIARNDPSLLYACELLRCSAKALYPESSEPNQEHLNPTAYVNDKLGHAAILRVYDAAIAASQEVVNHA